MVDTIKLAVEHGKLILVKSCETNTKTINGVNVKIDFRTNDWDGLSKTVAFFRGTASYGITLSDGVDSCDVPWEILNSECACNYEIGIFGVSNDIRLSTNRIEQHMNQGAYSSISNTQDPTPTLSAAVATTMQRLEDLTQGEIEEELLSFLDKIATIKLAVEHGKLMLVKDCNVNTKTINGVRVSIDFRSNEWIGLTKTVTFFRGQSSYGVLLPSGATSCYIPWEILDCASGCDYRIGIFGISSDMRLTTNKLKMSMTEGCYCNATNSQPPTPSAYEQLLAEINKIDKTSTDKTYIHTQRSASLTWTIKHNLNKYPSVSVVDSGNSICVGEVTYLDTDTLKVTFQAAFSGKAYLN